MSTIFKYYHFDFVGIAIADLVGARFVDPVFYPTKHQVYSYSWLSDEQRLQWYLRQHPRLEIFKKQMLAAVRQQDHRLD